MFNQLLDRSAALRDQLGPGGDAVSLQASLDGLWRRREAHIQRHEQQWQQQQPQRHTEPHMAQQPAASMNGQQHYSSWQQQHLAEQQQHQQQDAAQRNGQQQPGQQQGQQQQQALPCPAPLSSAKQSCLADSFSPQQARHLLMQWHLANIEFANATRLRCLSMRVSGRYSRGPYSGPLRLSSPHGALLAVNHQVWKRCSARLLSKLGPATFAVLIRISHACLTGGASVRMQQHSLTVCAWVVARMHVSPPPYPVPRTRLPCLISCPCRVQHWDLDDEHEHQGCHVFLPGGNLRLLEGLAQGIPIFYNAPARLLQYSSTGVSAAAVIKAGLSASIYDRVSQHYTLLNEGAACRQQITASTT